MCSSAPGHVHFVQTPHPANQDIRTQAADIASEGGDGTVGRHQQREYVEALGAINLLEPRIIAAGGLHERKSVGAVPRMAIDARTVIGT